ncbi:MAG: biopolymer transporter ExbD [Candidatus Dactylopiibacterium carminicum]|uniref:Biopolymer transporter ExbD n=1 Tax=Candidatus Dactylopiibacterium carminicum TaxID=857335 RepID=A0A272EXU4_9RHOO|nr:biopolymer transporter ExbD [Candidatus Dactylopiibacterium carminicum]KAF7600506.1 biopolymer transporter ExbD [Candidatus Dactylopiibacterium carminicum]PAS94925.1 MAG: biopolymer transporter ExbD [Candidatus Dactylopiibacterium carminicum]PAS98062.1 MAG: biopolymer transporter ExbD [Candidatus Dactylopiibacterium carminicum]PAT00511.1 MAG: biopolymer transporter ExbD [Candidatus Dactylopiibacterium carminicum]
MSMSSSEFDSDGGAINEINMTPLIDVMLVLLIIFIVTLPVIHGAVNVELPQASNQPVDQQERTVDISVAADGTIYWDKEAVSDGELQGRVAAAAANGAQQAPVVRIYADKAVRYERVAYVLSSAQGGGLSKIDFVTDGPLQ